MVSRRRQGNRPMISAPQAGRPEQQVADDGYVTGDPRSLVHGLGLGGVRKRVKQMGGEVDWQLLNPGVVTCLGAVRDLSSQQ